MATKAKKTKGFANMGNRPMYEAITAKFSSGAAGSHDNRASRQRTRSTAKRAAVNSGW